MATGFMVISVTHQDNETDMIPMDREELNAKSEFQMATPSKSTQGDDDNTHDPKQAHSSHERTTSHATPSIPNTLMRNLRISTPIDKNADLPPPASDNTSSNACNPSTTTTTTTISADDKQLQQQPQQQQQLIRDSNAYLLCMDNKQLIKVAEMDAHQRYNRVQAHDLSALDKLLQSTRAKMVARKRKKLEKQQQRQHDKQEMDADAGNNTDAKATETDSEQQKTSPPQQQPQDITNANRLEIIDKAIGACCQQISYFNQLFFNPIESLGETAGGVGDARVMMDKTQMCADKKALKIKIERTKAQIAQKRQSLMGKLNTLRSLRAQCSVAEVNIPQKVRQKITNNIEGGDDQQQQQQMFDAQGDASMRQIVSMLNENRKKQMMAADEKLQQLKDKDLRLKQRAQQIKHDEEKLQKLIRLKQLKANTLNALVSPAATAASVAGNRDHDDDTVHSNVASARKQRLLSMDSSIDSTIHTNISPLIRAKHDTRNPAHTENVLSLRFLNSASCLNMQPDFILDVDGMTL